MLLMLFLRNIINIRNRMKRSSSSSAKENSIRNAVAKLSAKTHTNNQHFKSFNSNNSLLAEHTAKYSQTPNPYFQEFYKTFGSSNFGEWSRPQSKQAYRKTGSRPETSKGVRPVEKLPKRWVRESKDIGFYSQYIPEKVSEQIREQLGSHIQIIVTKSHKKGIEEKAPRSKFETDLDDEFLQLFAN